MCVDFRVPVLVGSLDGETDVLLRRSFTMKNGVGFAEDLEGAFYARYYDELDWGCVPPGLRDVAASVMQSGFRDLLVDGSLVMLAHVFDGFDFGSGSRMLAITEDMRLLERGYKEPQWSVATDFAALHAAHLYLGCACGHRDVVDYYVEWDTDPGAFGVYVADSTLDADKALLQDLGIPREEWNEVLASGQIFSAATVCGACRFEPAQN